MPFWNNPINGGRLVAGESRLHMPENGDADWAAQVAEDLRQRFNQLEAEAQTKIIAGRRQQGRRESVFVKEIIANGSVAGFGLTADHTYWIPAGIDPFVVRRRVDRLKLHVHRYIVRVDGEIERDALDEDNVQ